MRYLQSKMKGVVDGVLKKMVSLSSDVLGIDPSKAQDMLEKGVDIAKNPKILEQ